MAPSWFQILIVVVLVVLLFGRNKISDLMGDVAKGIKSFRKGMSDDEVEEADTKTVKAIDHDTARAAEPAKAATPEKSEAS